jgi:hypothetical protein
MRQLVAARAVEVPRVDERDAGVERGMEGGDALAVVGRAVEVGHPHRAEAEGGDGGPVVPRVRVCMPESMRRVSRPVKRASDVTSQPRASAAGA